MLTELNKEFHESEQHTLFIIGTNGEERQSLIDFFKSEYNIITDSAKNGVDVLIENRKKICAILIDVEDTFKDAFDLLEIIKNDSDFSNIPVIVIANTDSVEYAERCFSLGVSDFLVRPFNLKLCSVRLKNLLKMNEMKAVLHELARDELTLLFTKQSFIRRANDKIKKHPNTQFGILGIEFENFKVTNSQYGQEKCDEYLAYIGRQIREIISTGIPGRYSGDQFVVLFELNYAFDENYVEKMIDILKKNSPIPTQVIKFGFYSPIDPSVPIVNCCDRAFLAIKEIKGLYEKRIAFYDERINQQLLHEQKIQILMESSLKNGEFQVYYQPKHDSQTGKIAGAESLIRWIHPEYGFMSPGQFIPLFEKNGFISKVDAYVLKRVCEDLSRWQKDGITVVPISINVSRRDYFVDGWFDNQLKTIDSYKIDHNLIHLEVTESLYCEQTDLIIQQVSKAQNLGYKIEMDDFGSGYSSLGMLATFPLDVIKLDISFVRQLEVNEIVVESIIKMAHRLNFTTVAEGAETEEQVKVLKSLGCDLIQGYYYSKPLPAQEFEEYLRRQ